MAATAVTVGELLKIVYGDTLRRTIPEEVTLLNWTQSKNKVWNEGQFFTEPVNLRRNPAHRFSAGEGGTLPVDAAQGYQMRRVGVRTAYAKVQFTRQMIERTESAPGKAAFAKVVSEEMEGIKRDAANNCDVHMYRDGTGILAVSAANYAPGSTVITLNHYANSWESGHPYGRARYFEVGDSVQFLNSVAPATVRCTKTITAVNYTNNTITVAVLGALEGITAGDFVVRGDANGNEYNVCVEGLYNVFNDATYQNIPRAAHPRWAAHIFNNAGALRPLKLHLIQRAIDYPANVGFGDGADFILSHTSIKEEYIRLVDGDLRYVTLDLVWKRGAKKLVWTHGDRDIPWDFGRNCPYHVLFALDSSAFEWDIMTDWHWVDLDGNVMKYAGNNQDNYFAYMAVDGNLSCNMPNKQVIITDIQVSPDSLPY